MTTARLRLFSVLLSAATLAQAQDLALPGADLQIKNGASRYVAFGDGFAFPFAGVRHAGMWVHGCGYVTLGGLGQSSPAPDVMAFLRRGDEFDLVGGLARIAPFWADLAPDPAGKGRVRVLAGGPDEVRVTWLNVPLNGQPGSTVTASLLLRKDGSFRCEYPYASFTGATVLAGYAAGWPLTTGAEPTLDLSAQPGPIGTGTQPAMFEYFTGGSFDLAGKTLEFAPVLPGKKQLSLSGDDAAEVDLGFAFPFYGNRYRSVWVSSNGDLSFAGWSPLPMLQVSRDLAHDTARIVPLGLDMNPVSGGAITVDAFPDHLKIGWVGIPMTERTEPNTAWATLWQDGTVRFDYGAVHAPGTTSKIAVVGVSGGYPVANGTETETSFASNQTYGTGNEAMLFQVLQGPRTFPFANGSLTFRPFTRVSDLPLVASYALGTTHRYVFPQGMSFPFAGETRTECFVNSNGTLTFGGPSLDQTPTEGELLAGFPVIAALWNAYDPQPSWSSEAGEGRIRVSQAGDALTFAWTVSEALAFNQSPTTNDFRVVLHKDGRFETGYGRVDSKKGIAGYATGADFTSGGAVKRMLSAPGALNRGGETAVYQPFDGLELKVDLANRLLAFVPVSGALLAGTPRVGGRLPIPLAAGRGEAGMAHLLALSFTATAGFPLTSSLRFPLDLDPMLQLSLTPNALMTGFVGPLDGRGRSAWPVLTVPNVTSLTGLPLATAFTTLDFGSGTFRTVSAPAAFQLGGAAVATGCQVSVIKQVIGNALSVKVTVTNNGVPCVGTLVGAWLYGNNPQQNPVAVLGFKPTDANGEAVFNANQAANMVRASVRVRTAGDCCTNLSGGIEL